MLNLKPQTLEAIDLELTRFPQKRSAMMNVLHLIQDDQGYLSDEAVQFAAGKLGVEPIHVLEVITFYPMYRQAPVGKVHISVCRTLSCALRGSYTVRQCLEKHLGCDHGHTSADGKFSIEWAECLGSCGSAPVVHVNGALHEKMDPSQMDVFASKLKELAEAPAPAHPSDIYSNAQKGNPAYMG